MYMHVHVFESTFVSDSDSITLQNSNGLIVSPGYAMGHGNFQSETVATTYKWHIVARKNHGISVTFWRISLRKSNEAILVFGYEGTLLLTDASSPQLLEK